MNPNFKKWLSVTLTTVGGALTAYFAKALSGGQLPSSPDAWHSLETGALIAVLASLIHLFQDPPLSTAQLAARRAARGMIRLGVLAGVSVLATIIGLVCFATDVIVGCNPANTAAIVDAGVCVTEGALAGLSVADIAKKCAIDVGTVLTTLNKSERKDVQSSPAYGEMKRAMVSLGRDAG